jgi:hypothetical protein
LLLLLWHPLQHQPSRPLVTPHHQAVLPPLLLLGCLQVQLSLRSLLLLREVQGPCWPGWNDHEWSAPGGGRRCHQHCPVHLLQLPPGPVHV